MKNFILTNPKKIYLFLLLFFTTQRVSAIENPINADSINELIDMILRIVIAVGTPIAIIFLVYSGFLFVKAQGKPTELASAKETFIWTLVGIAILLGASILAAVIEGTITQLGAGV